MWLDLIWSIHFKLPYLLDDRDFVIVANGVFTQEVKFHYTLVNVRLLMEGDMFNTQGAAAHCVCCLSLFFLITSSQGQLKNCQQQIKTQGSPQAALWPISPDQR